MCMHIKPHILDIHRYVYIYVHVCIYVHTYTTPLENAPPIHSIPKLDSETTAEYRKDANPKRYLALL